MAARFLQLSDVSEVLNISAAQTYALVRSGELPAIKIGGRGQKTVARGGKGAELWKRGAVKRVILPEPVGPNLDAPAPAPASSAKK